MTAAVFLCLLNPLLIQSLMIGSMFTEHYSELLLAGSGGGSSILTGLVSAALGQFMQLRHPRYAYVPISM
jgi:hypothetical protein